MAEETKNCCCSQRRKVRERTEEEALLQRLSRIEGQVRGVRGMVENSAYRLANSIKKTQKRANALGNVQIPQMQKTIKSIDEVLSEREREEFSRLKVIKAQKEKEEA